jgi:hypothetical protein
MNLYSRSDMVASIEIKDEISDDDKETINLMLLAQVE